MVSHDASLCNKMPWSIIIFSVSKATHWRMQHFWTCAYQIYLVVYSDISPLHSQYILIIPALLLGNIWLILPHDNQFHPHYVV